LDVDRLYNSPMNGKIAVNFTFIFYEFKSEIFKLTPNCVPDRICSRLCSEFMNSFARRQHLFDVAAKPIDVASNFLSYPVPLLLF